MSEAILRRFYKMKHSDVLVTVTTTPAWTPLFAMASAIVTDLGRRINHSSTVPGEYGNPAVVSTGIATRRITDGRLIVGFAVAAILVIVDRMWKNQIISMDGIEEHRMVKRKKGFQEG